MSESEPIPASRALCKRPSMPPGAELAIAYIKAISMTAYFKVHRELGRKALLEGENKHDLNLPYRYTESASVLQTRIDAIHQGLGQGFGFSDIAEKSPDLAGQLLRELHQRTRNIGRDLLETLSLTPLRAFERFRNNL